MANMTVSLFFVWVGGGGGGGLGGKGGGGGECLIGVLKLSI